MKRKFDLRILENADDSTIETMSERYKAVSDTESEEIYRKVLKKGGFVYEKSNEESQLFKVQKYNRKKSFGYASICFLTIAVMLSGVYIISQNKRISEDTVQSEEKIPDMTTSDFTSYANEYNTSIKQYVFGKMISSTDFYEKVSGRLIQSYNMTTCNIVDFEVDMESSMSYSHIQQCWITDEIISGNIDNAEIISVDNTTYDFINYSDGKKLQTYNLVSGKQEEISESVTKEMNKKYQDSMGDFSSDEAWKFKIDTTNCPYASDCIFPFSKAGLLLSDYEKWSIDGEETYLNRECISISGVSDNEQTSSFDMLVDKESGVLLKFKAYNNNNELSQFLSVYDIAFDENAKDVRDINEVTKQ